MMKSKDKNIKTQKTKPSRSSLTEVPSINYTNLVSLPAETRKLLADNIYEIRRKSALTWDGRQFIARIPKEIAEEWKITKENKMVFVIKKPRPDSQDKPELTITIE